MRYLTITLLTAFAVTLGATAPEPHNATQRSDITPRIYLHVGEETQVSWASSVQRLLQEAGYDVQGIQIVPAVPDQSDIRFTRYYDQTNADMVARLLHANGINVRLNYIGDDRVPSSFPRVLELWFSRDEPTPVPVMASQRNQGLGLYARPEWMLIALFDYTLYHREYNEHIYCIGDHGWHVIEVEVSGNDGLSWAEGWLDLDVPSGPAGRPNGSSIAHVSAAAPDDKPLPLLANPRDWYTLGPVRSGEFMLEAGRCYIVGANLISAPPSDGIAVTRLFRIVGR